MLFLLCSYNSSNYNWDRSRNPNRCFDPNPKFLNSDNDCKIWQGGCYVLQDEESKVRGTKWLGWDEEAGVGNEKMNGLGINISGTYIQYTNTFLTVFLSSSTPFRSSLAIILNYTSYVHMVQYRECPTCHSLRGCSPCF